MNYKAIASEIDKSYNKSITTTEIQKLSASVVRANYNFFKTMTDKHKGYILEDYEKQYGKEWLNA